MISSPISVSQVHRFVRPSPIAAPIAAPIATPVAAGPAPAQAAPAAEAVRGGGIPLVDAANLIAVQESGQAARRDNPTELTEEEERIVQKLRRQDAEVRRHERAHAAAAGPYGSPPVFQYTRGPDGKLYAIDGEVRIDVNAESSPEATIAKMEIVIRAALAPANPSSEDRAVANKARQQLIEAQRELGEKKKKEEEEAGTRRDETAGLIGSTESVTRSPAEAASAYQQAAFSRSAQRLAETAFEPLQLVA
jgi:hypothetical protein